MGIKLCTMLISFSLIFNSRLGFYQGTMAYSDFVHKFEEIEKFGEGGKTLHMNNHRLVL